MQRWVLPAAFLVLVMGLLGGVASGPARNVWSAFATATPDVLATAEASDPPLIRASAQLAYARRLRALECACDPGLAMVETGAALGRDLRTIAGLQRKVQHWGILERSLRINTPHLVSALHATSQVTANDTRTLFQGLEPIKRVSGTFRVSYELTATGGLWRVAQATVTGPRTSVRIWTAPRLTVAAAFVMDDVTGHPLFSYNADAERYVASTAKMMTALVALQHLPLSAVLTVPLAAAVPGTTANLAVGERIRARDVFYGMLLPSGNDAAVTLAYATAGSIPRFATLMNAEARVLHLSHSHFVVPHGLDFPGQYSSARDLAFVAHALLKQPFLAQVVDTRFYRAVSVDGVYAHEWTNLNHLLGAYPGAIGVKTGTTPAAGANLVASAVRGRRRIVAVLLGDSVTDRFSDARALLNYGWRLLGYGA